MTLDIPLRVQRWVLAKHYHGSESLELPINMMLGKSYAPRIPRDTLIIHQNPVAPLGNTEDKLEKTDKKVHAARHNRTNHWASY